MRIPRTPTTTEALRGLPCSRLEYMHAMLFLQSQLHAGIDEAARELPCSGAARRLLVCWVQVSPFGTTRLHTHGTLSMAGLQEEWKQQALKAGYEEVRCKVALWSLGNVDLVQGSFDCKFRVTTWWSPARQQRDAIAAAVEAGSTKQLKCEVLTRDKGEVPFAGGSIKVDIPPLALHNAMVFESDTSGAELHAIEPQPTRVLLRWTCMYIGTFSDVPCDDELYPFPYDHHWLEIHLGVS